MKNSNDLRKDLISIDGRGYKSYKQLEGMYEFNKYILAIDKVQGDPFASPSRVRIIIKQSEALIPKELIDNKNKIIAVQDYLTRAFYKNINMQYKRVFGSGKSGVVSISRCSQEIIDRTSVIVDNEKIEARILVGFPARGRTVLAKELEKILFEFLPKIVESSLIYKNLNTKELIKQVELVEDQEFIRGELHKRNLIAFVGNGSILPRESGVSSKVLKDGKKFYSPKLLEVEFDLPNIGRIVGMGIPKGITLIVGGGYHGKSTLLRALELGVYNHIEGDGREFVITDSSAVKVRAEDGRVIHNDDISLFINNLPNRKDTKRFFSENASGSTSQAANIVEGIESGTSTFLIDEDTSATNFMIRDDVMQSLVSKDKEPITPFIEIVKALYEQKGISTIIVVGSCGDYFDIADKVIQMDEYEAKDVTERAKELSTGKILERINQKEIKIDMNLSRVVKKGSIESGPKGVKIKTLGIDGLSINRENIDLKCVEQIIDCEQVNSIGEVMKWAEDNVVDGKRSLVEITDKIIEHIQKNGLININKTKGGNGNFMMPRRQEIMAAFSRYRNLKVQ